MAQLDRSCEPRRTFSPDHTLGIPAAEQQRRHVESNVMDQLCLQHRRIDLAPPLHEERHDTAPTELLEQSGQRNTTLQSGQREDLYTLLLQDQSSSRWSCCSGGNN